jgi:uncharacterized protein YndB with AHSA1/START domain
MRGARAQVEGMKPVLFALLVATACGPSLATLHHGARRGQVQPGAPLHAHQRVVIAAPRERVFALLTDVAGWPRWQPNVTRTTAPTAVVPDAAFTWTNHGSDISSRLAAVRPGELIAWTGEVSLAKAVHVWRLSSPTSTTTEVDVEETMDGFLLTWFYGQGDLDAEMARSLANLKRAAEALDRSRATLGASLGATGSEIVLFEAPLLIDATLRSDHR